MGEDILPSQEENCQENEENFPSSQGSGRIQIAHQIPSFVPYINGSCLYDKVGELVAALMNSLACRVFKAYEKGGSESLTANILHIHRTIGIHHVKVTY